MIDVTKQLGVVELLSNINIDSVASFGIMRPQHMVEHLATTLRISTEKEIGILSFSVEKAEKIKFVVIQTKNEFPEGFKSPILPKEEVAPLIHPDLKSAIYSLQAELIYFEEYFKINPSTKTMNPTLGELDYEEWKIFHDKHFLHHFKQFGLV